MNLWVVDQTHRVLVKEASDMDPDQRMGELENENDERLAKWQIQHAEPVFSMDRNNIKYPVDLLPPFPYVLVSLPLFHKGNLNGILNLYSKSNDRWPFQEDFLSENIEFLKTISSQMGIFIENRSLHEHATIYKEIHHRVKNNLQNIASLLRMQIRRLEHIPPERALNDSISRIMSIAAVHEILSHGQIGMVDLGQLVGRLSKISSHDRMDALITLDISGPSVMLPSKVATTVAIVINELIQNAVQHGVRGDPNGKVSIRVGRSSGFLEIMVQDNGPGLPEGFDMERDANLGLTIVRTLVNDELSGKLLIEHSQGTRVEIAIPLPQRYHDIA